jgi:P-type E1-E2 ATPase
MAETLKKTQVETSARLLKGGKEFRISASDLKKGDIVVCEANDVIPADGEVIEGIASVDESAITGESAPVIRERRVIEARLPEGLALSAIESLCEPRGQGQYIHRSYNRAHRGRKAPENTQ